MSEPVNSHRPTEEIKRAFTHFLDTFLVNRDAERTRALMSKEICGFGTGADEMVCSWDDNLELIERDIEQAPNPLHYTLTHQHFTFPSPDTAIIMVRLDLDTIILEQSVKLIDWRLSVVMQRREAGWLVEHMHISQPSTAHEDDESYPVKELEDRAKVLERQVKIRTRALELAQSSLQKLAITDPLTKLYNRLEIDETFEQALQSCRLSGQQLTLILLDLDRFKQVNDENGHAGGDAVLRGVADLLKANCRQTDVVGRWGGEEFLVLCPQMDLTEAVELAERLRTAIAQYDAGINRHVTASFGVATCQHGDTRESLLERADKAMYQAKHEGRNRVVAAD